MTERASSPERPMRPSEKNDEEHLKASNLHTEPNARSNDDLSSHHESNVDKELHGESRQEAANDKESGANDRSAVGADIKTSTIDEGKGKEAVGDSAVLSFNGVNLDKNPRMEASSDLDRASSGKSTASKSGKSDVESDNFYDLRFDMDRKYFPCDEMEGKFAVDAISYPVKMTNLRAIIICDVSFRDSLGLMWSDRIIREHVDLPCEPLKVNESKRIPFSIKLPEKSPPSLSSASLSGVSHREVCWQVRVVVDDENGNGKCLVTHPFVVGTAYEPAHPPKAEAWRRTLTKKGNHMKVDIELSKNVYYENEPVEMTVNIDNRTDSKVKSVDAKVYQRVVLAAPHDTPTTKDQLLGKSKKTEDLPGAQEKGAVHLSVTPIVPEDSDDVCIREVTKTNGNLPRKDNTSTTPERSLAPSVYFVDPREERPESLKMTFSVSYVVLVKVSRGFGRSTVVELPFTLGDNVENLNVQPRKHKSDNLRASSKKYMLGLGSVEVMAVPRYGEEEEIIALERIKEVKLKEKKEKNEANQRSEAEKNELKRMHDEQKKNRGGRNNKNDLQAQKAESTPATTESDNSMQ
eukprot:CFRG1740T1